MELSKNSKLSSKERERSKRRTKDSEEKPLLSKPSKEKLSRETETLKTDREKEKMPTMRSDRAMNGSIKAGPKSTSSKPKLQLPPPQRTSRESMLRSENCKDTSKAMKRESGISRTILSNSTRPIMNIKNTLMTWPDKLMRSSWKRTSSRSTDSKDLRIHSKHSRLKPEPLRMTTISTTREKLNRDQKTGLKIFLTRKSGYSSIFNNKFSSSRPPLRKSKASKTSKRKNSKPRKMNSLLNSA